MPKDSIIRICVRLPNWLGDVVMSFGFLNILKQLYPSSSVTVVIKKGLEPLVANLPVVDAVCVFPKEEYKGLRGVWRFGKQLKEKENIDLFFVLPDSLSAAVMAFASGAKQKIGYRNEARSILITHAYNKPKSLHRVEEYATLLYLFNPVSKSLKPIVQLSAAATRKKKKYIVVNINSEAVSRRLPVEKAVAMIALLQRYSLPLKLIGSGKEKNYVDDVYERLQCKNETEVIAGKTSLQQLTTLIQNAALMVSSDSGPAHIASASNVPLVVLFGAGDEKNTGPYQNDNAIVVRNGKLPCEPCVKNTCKLAPLPVCLMQLELQKVIAATDILLSKNE